MTKRRIPITALLILVIVFLTSCTGRKAGEIRNETVPENETEQNIESTPVASDTEEEKQSPAGTVKDAGTEPGSEKESRKQHVEEKKPVIETLTLNTISDGTVLVDVEIPDGLKVTDRGNNYICLEQPGNVRRVDYYVYDLGEADADGVYFVEEYLPLLMSDFRSNGAKIACTAKQYEGWNFDYTLVMLDAQWGDGIREGLVIAWAPTGVPGVFVICEVDDGGEDAGGGRKSVDLTNAELEAYLNASALHQ